MSSFIKAVQHAAVGIVYFFKQERNGKIQGFIGILAILMGAWLHITAIEWILVILCIAVVIALEMINTAIEKTANFITSEFHPHIKNIKDIAAAAVLWAAICSTIIGAIIFLPKILSIIFI
jgi:undecaprenol kinase/diacylglycerol kinase (ATP)